MTRRLICWGKINKLERTIVVDPCWEAQAKALNWAITKIMTKESKKCKAPKSTL